MTMRKSSWQLIYEQHQRRYHRDFVVCESRYEREFIISLVLGQFSRYSRWQIEKAIDACCASMKIPRAREAFLECLKQKLAQPGN